MATELFGVEDHEQKNNLERLKLEEHEGLEHFYRDILTPEMLEHNFTRWQTHLNELLERKYSDRERLEQALQEARDYVATIPVSHGTNLESIRNSTLPYLSSDFIVRGSGNYLPVTGNTTSSDRKRELDHFVYASLGIITPGSRNSRGGYTRVYIRNRILTKPGTLVALEDWCETVQRTDGNSLTEEEAFNIHLQQIWRGANFMELLPLMLAYAYDRPDEFERSTPFPIDLVPEGMPSLTRRDYGNGPRMPDFPHFEVRIPEYVAADDLLALVIPEADFDKNDPPISNLLAIIPSDISPEEARSYIKKILIEKSNINSNT